jgi:hypothetical protein
MSLLLFALLLLFPQPQAELITNRVGNVYTTDEEIKFRTDGLDNGAKLRISLTDAAGRPAAFPDQKMSREATVENEAISVGKLSPGWYRLNADPPDGKTVRVDIAVARPRAVSDFRDNSPFGTARAPLATGEWDLFQDMGVAWIQFAIPWGWAERQPGAYWFTPGAPDYGYDVTVKEATNRKMRVIIHLRSVPRWANRGQIGSYVGEETRTEMYPPDDDHWDDFEKFIGVVAERFKPMGVRHYELWSEAEGSFFKGWNTPRFPKIEAYQKMITRTRSALRAHLPDAVLIAPGDIPVNFLTDAEEGYTEPQSSNPYAGRSLPGIGKNKVDIVAGHFYWTDWQSRPRRIWSPEEKNPGRRSMTLQETLADARRQAGSRPLWNTEAGYASARSIETPDQMFATEDEQANLLVRYYMLNLAYGVEKIFWYTWKDTDQTSYGLLRSDGVAKPAYIAYRTMTERLEGLKFDRLMESGPDRWIARFTGPKTALVVWNTASGGDSPGQVRVAVPWNRVRITSRDGVETIEESENGKVGLRLRRGEPVYLDAAP